MSLPLPSPRAAASSCSSSTADGTKRVGRITVDLTRELYASANSTVYMGTIGSKIAVVKVTRSKGAESAGENKEEAIMTDLAVSGAHAREDCVWEEGGLRACLARVSDTSARKRSPRALQHVNVVRVYGAESERESLSTHHFLAMEPCVEMGPDGTLTSRTLSSLVRSGAVRTRGAKLELLRQITRGLQYLHGNRDLADHGLTHRD